MIYIHVYSPRKPQMSEPTSGTPNIWKLSMPGILKYMSSAVARLSPVQCPVCTPEPANVDRDMMNDRTFCLIFSSAVLVAIASVKPVGR